MIERALGRQRWAARAAAAVFTAALVAVGAHAAPPAHTVRIEGMRFVPETLKVRVGDRIVWHNTDLVPHTATAAGVFDSGAIAATRSWAHVVGKRGNLPYVCTYHPNMKGTLSVE